jgi:arylsulfatase A-like enzyme/Tfp pilus assembly protein PilF
MKFLRIVVCLIALAALPAEAFENVLLISVDTLRPDHLGCYGSSKIKTPHIDSLARTGVLFKNAVAPTPYTLPSHVSMMTGLIPPAHGVRDNGGFYLDKKHTTLAEMFVSNGMKTGAFVGAFPLDSRFGMDQGFGMYDDNYPIVRNVNELTMPERSAESVAMRALDWIVKQGNSNWFAFVHFYDPHFPYAGSYQEEISRVDQAVGKILSYLREKSIDQKTLVVFTADHGESLGEHQERTHGIFGYESTLRVPLIFFPFKPKVVEDRVRLIDVAPTILALQNLSFQTRTQGVSLVDFITGKSQKVGDSYFESLSMHFSANWAPLSGFYSGEMKFVDLPLPELYDLNKDPKEATNLCSDKQLCNLWKTKFQTFSRPYQQAEVKRAEVDKETMEQLRALGYVTGGSKGAKTQYEPKDDPKNLISFHNKVDAAVAFLNKGYDLKALELLEEIISERPDYSLAYEHASFIRSSLGFPEQAVDLLKKAIENGVSNDSILGKLGLYLYEARKYDEAIKQLNVVLTRNPEDLDALNHLGMTYTAMGKYTQAEDTFRKALVIDSSNSMSISNLGTLFLTQKKYDLAEKQFEAALVVNPHQAGAYNSLAVIHANRKNWTAAIQNWNLALKEDPKNFDAMLNLAFAYLENSQNDEALKLLQEFEKNAPRNRYAQDLKRVRSLMQKLR